MANFSIIIRHIGWVMVLLLLPALAQAQFKLRPHPRLYYTAAEHRQALAQLKTDDLLQASRERIIKEARRIIAKEPLPTYTPDERNNILPLSRKVLRHVNFLGMAWRHTNDNEIRQRLIAELDAVCGFNHWDPPHFLDVAEMTTAVAIGYDWLYPTLSPEQRQRYETNILEKGLNPYLAAFQKMDNPNVTTSIHNWNLVCSGGILAGALAVGDKYPQEMAAVWTHVKRRFPESMVFYDPDGSWFEGPGYWGYATSYAILAFDALRTATGSTQGLDDYAGWRKTAAFCEATISPGVNVFNFADAGEKRPTSDPLLLYLNNSAVYKDLLREGKLKPEGSRLFPLIMAWYKPEPTRNPRAKAKRTPELTDQHFKGEVELIKLSNGQRRDTNHVWFMAKAGSSQRNHQQLDIGTFVYEFNKVMFLVDMGAERYALPNFWGREPKAQRWKYFRNNNRSHSTLVIADTVQNPLARVTFASFKARQDQAAALLDMTEAYAPYAQGVYRRFSRNGYRITIKDSVTLNSPQTLQWQAVTDAEMVLENNVAFLSKGGQHISLVAPPQLKWVKLPMTPPTTIESQNEGHYRLALQFPAASRHEVSIEIVPMVDDGEK